MRGWTVVAIGLVAISAASTVDAAPPLNLPIEDHVLGNGLRIVLAPDPSLDDVTVLVRYDVGSSDDPTGKDGLAHLTEHMMYEGSEHVPKGDYWRWLDRAGATGMNGVTSLDTTSYFATVPPEAVPLVFWMASDRMGFVAPRIQQASLDHERELVRKELDGRLEDQSLGGVPGVVWTEVFPRWHPYHRDHDPRWLANQGIDDVRAFLRTWYAPQNATLIVAGRFAPQVVLALAQKYFGDLPSHSAPERPALPESWTRVPVVVEMRAPVARDIVTVVWPAPALGQPGDAALDLAAAVLTDPEGRLQAELTATGLVTRVTASESSMKRGSLFAVQATIADGKSPDNVARSIRESVRRLGQSVTAQEIARARAEWTDALLLRLETSSGRAQWLSGNARSADPWGAHKYDGVDATSVAEAVRTTLGAPEVTIIVRCDRNAAIRGEVQSRHEGAR